MEAVGASRLHRGILNAEKKGTVSRERKELNGAARDDGVVVQHLKWRLFILYFMGFIDLFGISMIIPLLPKFMYNHGISRSIAGLIGSVYGAIQIFSSPVIGKMSDVYGRRGVLLLCYFGSSLGYFSLSYSGTILMLILSRIPSGILKHGISISKAYLADVTEPKDRPGALGYFNAISSTGFIIGPLLSGYLADIDPTLRLSFLTGATIYAMNFFCVLLFFPSSEKKLAQTQDVGGNLNGREGTMNWKALLYKTFNVFKGFRWRGMKDIIAIRFFTALSVMMFRYNFSVFMEEVFSISSTRLGQITSFNSVASVVASATCGYTSKYYDHSAHIVHFIVVLVLSLFLVTLSFSVYQVMFCLVLLSISTSNIRVCMLSLFLQRGREDERGAIVGFSNSMSSFCRMLTPSLVGVAQEYGSRVCGGFAVMLALLALIGTMVYPIRNDSDGKESHTRT